MFFYDNWDRFCKNILHTELKACTAEESLKFPADKKFIVLKHDVETDVSKALRLAEIEHNNGIKGTYYVQAYLLSNEENVSILKRMKKMGHEVSYHYDVLDANCGNFDKADKEFAKWLERFHANGFECRTICQHGNPIRKRIGYTSNRDFFRNSRIRSKYHDMVDVVVNYSNAINRKYIYISDAGYKWNHITEPETNDQNSDAQNISIGNFSNLLQYIKDTDGSVILSTHPHRWEASKSKIRRRIILFKTAKSTARILNKIPGVKSILNRFYFLAKKI